MSISVNTERLAILADSTALKEYHYLRHQTSVLNEERRKANCLMILVALDIFRGLRKYVFISSKKITRELSHLLDRTKYPAHYPQYLLNSDMKYNPVFFPENEIRDINSRIRTLQSSTDKQFTPEIRRMLISDQFFNQLIFIKNLDDLEHILSVLLIPSFTDRHYYISNKAEVKHHQLQGYYFIGKTPYHKVETYVNFTDCYLFVASQAKGAKRRLLVDGELDGELVETVFLSSLSYNVPLKETPLAALMLCLMQKMMMNSIGSTKASTFKYSYHLRKGKNERYIIMDRLDEDHVVPDGNFRLNKVVKSPIQFIEKILDGHSVYTYLRDMTAPLSTTSFLEEFDGNQLLKILESIPGFVYKFSEQQRHLIASRQNAVVVGRSGTGKTTCAVMRMIGIRLLEIAHKNAKEGIKKIRYQDLCESKLNITKDLS